MRVIAGEYGGRRLVAPRGRGTRPTSDRVREALFSILGDLAGAGVLDLFAGSGALAIEALSRGASRATLVDSSASAIAAARRNLESLGLEAEILHQGVLPFLRNAAAQRRHYDLVFADPPYSHASSLSDELGTALEPVLTPDARIVCESDRRAPLHLVLGTFQPRAERIYGDTLISIYGSR
jgi:16S rRNA (guanine966-N2)-methyltransferase